jgi:hypothetical protein
MIRIVKRMLVSGIQYVEKRFNGIGFCSGPHWVKQWVEKG